MKKTVLKGRIRVLEQQNQELIDHAENQFRTLWEIQQILDDVNCDHAWSYTPMHTLRVCTRCLRAEKF